MRRGLIIGVAAIVVVVAGGAAFIWFSGGSGEPSTDVTAPSIERDTTTTISENGGDGATTSEPSGDGPITFELTGESVATFTLEEDLSGVRTTVVGTTSEVAAQLVVDPDDPSSAQLGDIIINARTFTTGSDFRDRAIRSEILESANDEFELMTFSPTAVDGLPSNPGLPFSFEVTGDLTIRDVTQSVTFQVVIEEASSSVVVGTATAQVVRENFGLTIPSVSRVANVTEEVDLELFFVAEPVG